VFKNLCTLPTTKQTCMAKKTVKMVLPTRRRRMNRMLVVLSKDDSRIWITCNRGHNSMSNYRIDRALEMTSDARTNA